MTALAGVLLVAGLATALAVATAICWAHLDRLRRQLTAAEKRADRAGESSDRWQERAGIAEQTLTAEREQWFAEADQWALREQRHAARCPWAAADPEQARLS